MPPKPFHGKIIAIKGKAAQIDVAGLKRTVSARLNSDTVIGTKVDIFREGEQCLVYAESGGPIIERHQVGVINNGTVLYPGRQRQYNRPQASPAAARPNFSEFNLDKSTPVKLEGILSGCTPKIAVLRACDEAHNLKLLLPLNAEKRTNKILPEQVLLASPSRHEIGKFLIYYSVRTRDTDSIYGAQHRNYSLGVAQIAGGK